MCVLRVLWEERVCSEGKGVCACVLGEGVCILGGECVLMGEVCVCVCVCVLIWEGVCSDRKGACSAGKVCVLRGMCAF